MDLFIRAEVPKNFRKRIEAERLVLVKKQRQDEGADCPCRIKASPARTPELRDRVDFQQRGIASALRMCPLLGVYPKFLGAVLPRRALQLRKWVQCIFSTQNLMASGALVPAFDEQNPKIWGLYT